MYHRVRLLAETNYGGRSLLMKNKCLFQPRVLHPVLSSSSPQRFATEWLLILAIVTVGDGLLAQAPASFTQAGGPIAQSDATLNGMAVPNGTPTEAWFEWGTDFNYGQLTA